MWPLESISQMVSAVLVLLVLVAAGLINFVPQLQFLQTYSVGVIAVSAMVVGGLFWGVNLCTRSQTMCAFNKDVPCK